MKVLSTGRSGLDIGSQESRTISKKYHINMNSAANG